MFNATEEQIDWYFCFTEVFKKLNNERLAEGRLVVDNKILKWSAKLVGYYHCDLCSQTFNSINSQVEFHYRIVPKHRRGELRLYKQYGQMCRKCQGMEYIVPKIDPDDKLYAMECLLVKVMHFFYNEPMEMPQRKNSVHGQGEHHSQGCEACFHRVCRCNPLFKGILVDQSVFPRPPTDVSPRIIEWKIYFGSNSHPFELSFEDRFAHEQVKQEERGQVERSSPSSKNSRRRGHSISGQSDNFSQDDELEHERMSQGEMERTVFSSRTSSVCGDTSTGSTMSETNKNIVCEDALTFMECSKVSPYVNRVQKPKSANIKPELNADNFDSIYSSIFTAK